MKKFFALLIALFILIPSALAGEIKPLVYGDEQPFSPDEEVMKVYFFQVRAQDATLIVAGGETMLVDAGHFESGPYIAQYLRDLGITRIDYAVNSHPHDDHINGFISLMDEIEIGAFYVCFPRYVNQEMINAISAAEKHNIPVVVYDENTDLSFGGNKIRLYQNLEINNMNANSMVMHVSFGECSTVLTGDINRTVHTRLAEDWGENLKCDIFKLPHHGLYTPKKIMITTADPEICVLTNGDNKQTNETVRFVSSWKYPIIHTPHGTIEYTTNGEYWTQIQYPKVEWDD